MNTSALKRVALLALAAFVTMPVARTLGSDAPTYNKLEPDQFLKRWLVLKPIPVPGQKPPDEGAQKRAFAEDALLAAGNLQPRAGLKQKIGEGEFEWQLVESRTDIIDLKPGSNPSDFAIAYAWAEFDLPVPIKGFLGVGSDDAVKIWLNGKLIHDNWTARPTRPDDDLVPVEFTRGRNQLLLKVQNVADDWSFACRLAGKEIQADKLTRAAVMGDTDTLKRWLDQGMDVNGRNKTGLTAAQSARLHGQTESLELLARHGADTKAELPPPEKVADKLLNGVVQSNATGLAVLVAQDGRILFEKGYGQADRERHLPATAQTKFRIGSITKQFTAAAILKLQEEGKLSVHDKLAKYIPDFPRGDEVTLDHLLTHTSGIRSYTDKPGFMDTVTTPVKTEDLIQSFKNDPYDFSPGQKWHYDNSGYFLLGYIIEKVSGQTYGEFLRQNFFGPLGMTNTGVHRSGLHLDNEALGYSYDGSGFTNALNWDMSRAGGAGALYSTVEDLYRWNEGIFNGKVLSPASLKAAFTAVKTDENKENASTNGYGYGWFLGQLRGAQEISHGGGLQGFSSFLLRLPRERFTVVALANALPGAPEVEPSALAHALAEVYLGTKLEPRAITKVNKNVPPSAFEAVAGRYDYGGAIATFTHEGDHLYAQLAGQPRFEVFPKSETEYFWKVADAQVTFVKDSSGKVIKAIHHQSGQTITAPRLEDITESKIDYSACEPLLGKYDYGEGKTILTVTRSGNHLYAQLTGQPKYEIFPKSPTEFFWKVVDAQITFVKDGNGKVTKGIHHQGGHTMEVPKIE